MRSIEENIRALKRTVLNEAEAAREHAQQQASTERTEILARASLETERLRSQAVAAAQLQARTAELEHREKLLNSVFSTARQKLSDMSQRADYDQIARELLRQALMNLGADIVRIRADERTRAVLTDQVLTEVSAELGVQVTHGIPLERGVGLIVETADGHRQYDNTLETRLERLQNSLRAPVLRLLMGETL